MTHKKMFKKMSMRVIHYDNHTTEFNLFKVNKRKQRKQLWETGLGEWPWPQTPHRELGGATGDTWSFPGNRSRSRAYLTQLRPLPTFALFSHISQKVLPDGCKVGAASSWMHLARVPKIEARGVFWMGMNQYVSLQLLGRPGRTFWSSQWPSQMAMSVYVDT